MEGKNHGNNSGKELTNESWRPVKLAADGRFGNAMRTLGSNGTAPSTDPSVISS